MRGLETGNDATDLVGVAKVLGCKDAASLAQLRPSLLMKLTQRELLEAARVLRLTKVTRLNKEALLARVWEALQQAGAIPADAEPLTSTDGRRSTNGRSKSAPYSSAMAPASPAPVSSSVPSAISPLASPADSIPAPVSLAPLAPDPAEIAETPAVAVHKFDVGEGTTRGKPQDFAGLRAEAESHIPWSYGQNKVTALPVDPDRLFVYWEVTQAAVEQARGALGPGGKDAWLSLRVYDVSGRIFDGSNAHGYFDQGVGQDIRQWFFQISKPTSQAIVEIGLKSHEGYFVKIARSGRLEFPRREPVAWSDPEWMTVQVSTGVVEGSGQSGWSAGGAGGDSAGPPAGSAPGGPGGGRESLGDFASNAVSLDSGPGVRRRIWVGRSHRELGAFDGEESWTWEEIDGDTLSPEVIQAFSWEGDAEFTSWEAGPFDYPVEIPALVKESYSGPARIFRTGGRTHVVWGPWQVIIRGLGAHAEKRVISRWHMERAFTTRQWREVTTPATAQPLGSSGMSMGSSERWGKAASELRLGGASERFRLGASELRLGGASERAFVGASQLLVRGSSERRFSGSSELMFKGASERRFAGASERRLGGASELRLGEPASTPWEEPALETAAGLPAAVNAGLEHYGWPSLVGDGQRDRQG